MKKSIKAELISLAHKILQLKDDTSYAQMTAQSRALYEKLTVLSYAEKLEQSGQPTIGLSKIEASIDEVSTIETVIPQVEEIIQVTTEEIIQAPVEEKIEIPEEPETPKAKTPAEIVAENEARYAEARGNDKHRPDGTVFNEEDPLHEPVIEKIKDMVAEMPPEASVIDEMVESIEPQDRYQKNDMFEIGGEFAQMPIFDPVTVVAEEDSTPKNLNDKLKNGLKIGLNDKIAFIKHLFHGSDTDYNRVLSQLSTFGSHEEAKQFVGHMVKPDYNSWEGKEEYEERFMQIIESKFN